ncbi:MAG: stage II sporulation protein D [Oscillospiraceae bacterium]
MKKQIGIMLIFGILLLGIPCITFLNKNNDKPASAFDENTVKILFTKSDEVKEVSLEDYITGAVLAQMPAEFEDDALKSQAILAHTYILRRQITENENPDEKLKGADISDDTDIYQSYFTEEQAKEYYGDEYENAYKKVKEAVNDVIDITLTYDSQPIIVAFHAISCGKTESAKDIWGEDIPYLTSVDSSQDEEVDGFQKVTILSSEEITESLTKAFPDLKFSDIKDSLEIKDSTEAGTVLTVNAGGNEISGSEFARALSLPSPCFTFEYKDDKYSFTTKGYGHLIGMSQYGANLMAKEGKNYEEILSHYFPGTELTK